MTVLKLWGGERITKRDSTPSLRQIVADVAEIHCVSLDDMLSQSRVRKLARARQEAMWIARQVRSARRAGPRWSYPQIAAFFNRDHTTAIFGVRAHEQRRAAVE